MAEVSVKQLATDIDTPVDRLLQQFVDAGIVKSKADDMVTELEAGIRLPEHVLRYRNSLGGTGYTGGAVPLTWKSVVINTEKLDLDMAQLKAMIQRTVGVRREGSAALDLAYVAAGFTDGFFETGLSPWDVAAGSLLVTEAGGLIGNFTGESDFMEQRECLAANPRVYAQLVPVLHKYSKFASAGEKATVREATRTLTVPDGSAAPTDGDAPF